MLGRVVFDSMGKAGHYSEYDIKATIRVIRVRKPQEKKAQRIEVCYFCRCHPAVFLLVVILNAPCVSPEGPCVSPEVLYCWCFPLLSGAAAVEAHAQSAASAARPLLLLAAEVAAVVVDTFLDVTLHVYGVIRIVTVIAVMLSPCSYLSRDNGTEKKPCVSCSCFC